MQVKQMLVITFVSLLGVFSVAWQSDQTIQPGFGAVAGRVIDVKSGKPIAEAEVMAERDDAVGSGKVPHTITDSMGSFFLTDLPPGMSIIAASKEQDNYPDTDNAAFAAKLATLPKVSVQEGAVTRGIVVSLEKGGKLVGMILDSQTREPVRGSHIRLSRADNPKLWLRTGPDLKGRFELVIPSRPFHLEVSASGYRPWVFAGSSLNHEETLLVRPEVTKELVIELEKEQK